MLKMLKTSYFYIYSMKSFLFIQKDLRGIVFFKLTTTMNKNWFWFIINLWKIFSNVPEFSLKVNIHLEIIYVKTKALSPQVVQIYEENNSRTSRYFYIVHSIWNFHIAKITFLEGPRYQKAENILICCINCFPSLGLNKLKEVPVFVYANFQLTVEEYDLDKYLCLTNEKSAEMYHWLTSGRGPSTLYLQTKSTFTLEPYILPTWMFEFLVKVKVNGYRNVFIRFP